MTLFDFATIACFLGVVGAFFFLTEHHPRTLVHLLLPGIVFGVANQVGNAGYALFAWILIASGVGYAVMVVRQE